MVVCGVARVSLVYRWPKVYGVQEHSRSGVFLSAAARSCAGGLSKVPVGEGLTGGRYVTLR